MHLAQNKAVQDRLRAEIRSVKAASDGQGITVEQILAMPYLNAVTQESMRFVSVGFFNPSHLSQAVPSGCFCPPRRHRRRPHSPLQAYQVHGRLYN
jgi:cytochrome P450